MERTDSTQSIKLKDLIFRTDAVGIVFAHMKNDQLGSRERVPRHVFCN